MTSGATQAREKPSLKAIKRAEAEFAKRREAIEADETKTPDEKRDALLAAASELEWTVRAISERSAV